MTILSSQATPIFLGVCGPCQRPTRISDESAGGTYTRTQCRQCGQPVTVERLHATVTDASCHYACMGGTGPNCSCACGGDNHGKSWVVEHGEMLETALAAYRARREAKEEARAAKAVKAAARAQAALDQWAEETGAGEAVAYLREAAESHPFLEDMARRIGERKQLTPGQLSAVQKFMANDRARQEREAEEAATAQPVPTGKGIEVTGEIVYTRSDTNSYNYNTTIVHKMLVKGDGWKVWATIPRDIQPDTYNGMEWDAFMTGLKGRQVTFTATVEASDDDASFGIAKRPRKASLSPALSPA